MSQGSRGITTLQNKFPFLFLVSHRPCTVQVVSQSSCPPLNQPQTMLKICCTGKRKKKVALRSFVCLFIVCFVVVLLFREGVCPLHFQLQMIITKPVLN